MLILAKVLSLQFEWLIGIDSRHWRGSVNGGCVDVGECVERRRRSRVDGSSNGSGGPQVRPTRDGLDLQRQPGSLGRILLFVCRHFGRWAAAEAMRCAIKKKAKQKMYKESRAAKANRPPEAGLVFFKTGQDSDSGCDPAGLRSGET